jgi:peptide/nickel transport system permease protein
MSEMDPGPPRRPRKRKAARDEAKAAAQEDEKVVSAVAGAVASSRAGESYLRMVWRLFWRHWVNRIALVTIGLFFVLAAAADFVASDKPIYASVRGEAFLFPNLTDPPELRIYNNQILVADLEPGDSAVLPIIPYGYNTHDLDHVLAGPSDLHLLGTDERGRDVLARVVHGTRVSLLVGFLTVVVLVLIGGVLGSVAGYFGGLFDDGLNRVVETLNSIPPILVIAVVMAAITPQRWTAVLVLSLVFGLVWWTTIARLIRGEILKLKTLEYIDAARVLGASTPRILARHIVPNAISPVLVAATFATANAILFEGALSFIGFGIPDDMASWGGILQGVRFNHSAWWLGVFPGVAVFLTVTAFNLAGEGLRDAIDPRLKM